MCELTDHAKNILGGIEGSASVKTKEAYKKRQEHFQNYLVETKTEFCENTMINYFSDLSKSSTKSLWTYYSMVNAYTKVTYNQDMNNYYLLRDFMKKITKQNLPLKAPIFTQEQFDLICSKLENEGKELSFKIIALFSYVGLLRLNEVFELSFDNVDVKETKVYITIPKSKTRNTPYTFFIVENEKFIIRDCILKYISLVSNNKGKFFKNWNKFTKSYVQNMGINTVGSVASYCAK